MDVDAKRRGDLCRVTAPPTFVTFGRRVSLGALQRLLFSLGAIIKGGRAFGDDHAAMNVGERQRSRNVVAPVYPKSARSHWDAPSVD